MKYKNISIIINFYHINLHVLYFLPLESGKEYTAVERKASLSQIDTETSGPGDDYPDVSVNFEF